MTSIDVRIFGPNLSRAGQDKGDMHVHREGCGDCKHYGPDKRFGGGEHGWLVNNVETIEEITEAIYGPDEYIYDPETEIDAYTASIYFAPCVTLGNRKAAA